MIPVKIGGGDSAGNAQVSWLHSTGLNYDLTVILGIENLGHLGFLWGTADCGNDTIYGHLSFAAPAPPPPPPHVPIPGTVLLMSTGLLGLGLLGWRRRRN